jgi:hypothetical protein
MFLLITATYPDMYVLISTEQNRNTMQKIYISKYGVGLLTVLDKKGVPHFHSGRLLICKQ